MRTAYCNDRASFERSRFSHFNFLAHVPLKLLVSLISRLVGCSARIVVDRQTDRQRATTVTLAAHARRGTGTVMSVSVVWHIKSTEMCSHTPENPCTSLFVEKGSQHPYHYPRLMISVAFSAIMIVGAFVFPDTISGITEASTTRRFLTPFTLS